MYTYLCKAIDSFELMLNYPENTGYFLKFAFINMEKFIVSARKYRPQNFSTVVGQSHITTTLKNAIRNNQLAHAFLFCGPRGVGKTTCARILAKTINCENKTEDGEACNECNSCVSFDNGTSLNIHELDAASNNSVEDIRSLVDQVRFAPQAGLYKVYIIDEVHMLTSQAFNAFLKTLEEPPPFAIFILATTEKHKILPTILSRCQIFDFKRITNNDTVEHLQEICEKEQVTADKTALHVIAQKSEGCLRDSLSILDKIVSFTNGILTYSNTLEHLNILDEDYYFKMADAMQHQQLSDAILIFDEINRKGFEGDLVLNGFAEFLRNLLVSKDAKVAMLLEVSEGFKNRYNETASKMDASWLISALNIISESEINYRQAKNKRLHVELTLIKLCYLNQALDIMSDHNGISKKKQIDGVRPVSFRAITPIAEREKPISKPIATDREKPIPVKKTAPPQEEGGVLTIVQEPAPAILQPDRAKPDHTRVAPIPVKKVTKIGKLDMLRQKVERDNLSQQIKEIVPEALQKAWSIFIEKLQEDKNYSAVPHFKSAQLRILSQSLIEIVVDTVLQQKFIDEERADLVSHFQGFFNNRILTYQVIVEEDPNKIKNEPVRLTHQQQFELLTQKYPLVQELRDRLGLKLDL